MANETPRRGLLSSLRGLVRPPDLQTDEDRSASRLELFFDLAFVLVVAELAIALREEVAWESGLTFAGLFALVWWAWVRSRSRVSDCRMPYGAMTRPKPRRDRNGN